MSPPPAVRRLCRPSRLRAGGVAPAAAAAVRAVLTTFQHALVHSLPRVGSRGR